MEVQEDNGIVIVPDICISFISLQVNFTEFVPRLLDLKPVHHMLSFSSLWMGWFINFKWSIWYFYSKLTGYLAKSTDSNRCPGDKQILQETVLICLCLTSATPSPWVSESQVPRTFWRCKVCIFLYSCLWCPFGSRSVFILGGSASLSAAILSSIQDSGCDMKNKKKSFQQQQSISFLAHRTPTHCSSTREKHQSASQFVTCPVWNNREVSLESSFGSRSLLAKHSVGCPR